MLNILTCGLPVTAKEIVNKASINIFGEGMCEVVDLVEDSALRMRVRLSNKNASDAMVILDSVASNKCKSFENGLFSSSKYHEYVDDETLVKFLNTNFEAGVEYQPTPTMEVSSESNRELEEIIERLNTKVADKEAIIKNLTARCKELEGIIEDGDIATVELESDEMTKLSKENLELRDKLNTLSSEKFGSDSTVADLKSQVEDLTKTVEKLKEKQKSILTEFESVSGELTDYKVKFSTQSGLLKSREMEIESLHSQIAVLESDKTDSKVLQDQKDVFEKNYKESQVEVSKLRAELKSKESELIRLKEQLETGGDFGAKLKISETKLIETQRELLKVNKELVELKSSLGNMDEEREKSDKVISDMDSKLNSANLTISSLKDKVKALDASLIEANAELVKARSKVDMLEKSTNRDTDIEELYNNISTLRNQYENLSSSIFGKLSTVSSPKTSLQVNVVKEPEQFKRIRFVFSGSTESRKGTYRSLLEEFKDLPKDEKVVIVDAVSETCVDYVFEIQEIVQGLNWFVKGGGVQRYLSQTCLPNVQVLSPGLGYINDNYFLTVDWSRRLRELEASGYNIVLYCGDISSMVGRVLHESFASLGSSMVYVHGNAIGARTIVANFRGISNCKSSVVCYFDYNPKVEKFYRLVEKTNECRIISAI